MPFTDFSDPGFQAYPRRFGAYTLLRPLSRGGMGEVFLARTGALIGAERLCVLKTVRGDLANDDDYVRRFVEEARVAVTLTHSGVCHVFDAGRVGARLYLAMEHIAGMTLRELTDVLEDKQRKLTTAYVLHILIELFEALDYAHNHRHPESGQRMSVVHRDVSPQNVMVSFEGDVKLIDFGLSKSTSAAEATSDDMVMGKLFYMSPEQARGDSVDGRTDQFSAAVVGYEIFTGQRFYGARGRDDVSTFVGVGGFVPEAIGEVPAEVQRILLRALSAEADDRYPTCGEMAAELRRVLALNHPMMSRSTLKTFFANTLSEEQDAYRAQIRELPASASSPAASPASEVEQTQSFMVGPGTAAHTERVKLMRGPGDTDETAHLTGVASPRSTPRLLALGGAAALVLAVVGVGARVALPRLTAPDAPLATAPLTNAPRANAPLANGPLANAPLTTAVLATAPLATAPLETAPLADAPTDAGAVDAAPVDAAPSGAVAVDAPVEATRVVDGGERVGGGSVKRVKAARTTAHRKGAAATSEASASGATGSGSPTPTTPVAKLPGTMASKREIVSRCDVCKGIKNQIREGKAVAEEVLDSCIRRCRQGQGQP